MDSKTTLGNIYRTLKQKQNEPLELKTSNESVIEYLPNEDQESERTNTCHSRKKKEKCHNLDKSLGEEISPDEIIKALKVKKKKGEKMKFPLKEIPITAANSSEVDGKCHNISDDAKSSKGKRKQNLREDEISCTSPQGKRKQTLDSGVIPYASPQGEKTPTLENSETSSNSQKLHREQSINSVKTEYSSSDDESRRKPQNGSNSENDDLIKFLNNSAQKNKYQNYQYQKFIKDAVHSESFVQVPVNGKPRNYTISVAIPVSIITDTCPLSELKTYIIGQLARSLSIFCVDEVVLYLGGAFEKDSTGWEELKEAGDLIHTILEYQECPQYLRKYVYGYNHHLSKVGILNPLNSPHHLKVNEWCNYREGIVMSQKFKSMALVDIGLQAYVAVPQSVEPCARVTVKIPPYVKESRKRMFGEVVPSDEPRKKEGHYFGYVIRDALSLHKVFQESSFDEMYDLIIGTSDKGTDSRKVSLPPFKHALIVFGDIHGLETAFENDSNLRYKNPSKYFQYYLNTCPYQGSRTIRTEEAIPITLCTLRNKLSCAGKST